MTMRRERITSLRAKLVSTVFVIFAAVATSTMVVVGWMNFEASRRNLDETKRLLEYSIQVKGRGLAGNHALALRNLASDNAFSDVTAMVNRAVAEDEDVVYGMYVDKDGRPWAYVAPNAKEGEEIGETWKALGFAATDAEDAADQSVKEVARDLFGQRIQEYSARVVDDGETLGFIVYGISTRKLDLATERARVEARRELVSTLAILAGLAIVSLLAGTLFIRRTAVKITKPLGVLTEASKKIASGDYSVRCEVKSRDEIEVLGEAFNGMVSDLSESHRHLAELNHTLEQKVEARTAELSTRNRDMRLVLDNVTQGLVTLSKDGIVSSERSAVLESWFGKPSDGQTFWEYIGAASSDFAGWFKLTHDDLLEDIMPAELVVEQMPRRLTSWGRIYKFAYSLIMNEDGTRAGLLVVIDDITASEASARKEAEQREIMRLFEGVTADREGFLNAFAEASRLVEALRRAEDIPLSQVKAALHTLKGNSGILGFEVVSKLCHNLEDEIEAERALPPPERLNVIADRWEHLEEKMNGLTVKRGEIVEVPTGEYRALQDTLAHAPVNSDVKSMVASWSCEPLRKVFARFSVQAQKLAEKLGKGELDVRIEDHGVRADADEWGPLWSEFVHVVRNAVDHGLESIAEREAVGKTEPPAIWFESKLDQGDLIITCRDNGRGIDWEAVRTRARSRGMAHETQKDLIEALLSPSFSTRDTVTETSGRGVGMSAIRDLVRPRGGDVSVVSQAGRGTQWTIRVPALRVLVEENLRSSATLAVPQMGS